MNKNLIAYVFLGICLLIIGFFASSAIFACAKKDNLSVLTVIGQVRGDGYAR